MFHQCRCGMADNRRRITFSITFSFPSRPIPLQPQRSVARTNAVYRKGAMKTSTTLAFAFVLPCFRTHRRRGRRAGKPAVLYVRRHDRLCTIHPGPRPRRELSYFQPQPHLGSVPHGAGALQPADDQVDHRPLTVVWSFRAPAAVASADEVIEQIRTRHQSENRQGTWPDGAAIASGQRR